MKTVPVAGAMARRPPGSRQDGEHPAPRAARRFQQWLDVAAAWAPDMAPPRWPEPLRGLPLGGTDPAPAAGAAGAAPVCREPAAGADDALLRLCRQALAGTGENLVLRVSSGPLLGVLVQAAWQDGRRRLSLSAPNRPLAQRLAGQLRALRAQLPDVDLSLEADDGART